MATVALSLLSLSILAIWRPAVSGATCFRLYKTEKLKCFSPHHYRYMILNVVLQGGLYYSRDETDQVQNACGSGPATTTKHSTLIYDYDFDVVWYHVKVPFAPVKGLRRARTYQSGKATLTGRWDLKGSYYDQETCNQVTYPADPNQEYCTGRLSSPDRRMGFLLTNPPLPGYRPDQNHFVIDMTPVETAALHADPTGCNDSAGVFESWNSGGGGEGPHSLAAVNVSTQGHGLGSHSFVHGSLPLRLDEIPEFKSDCSVPQDQVVCHQHYLPNAHVYVYRVGVTD